MKPADGEIINGIDCSALRRMIQEVAQEPGQGNVRLQVATRWIGGLQSASRVNCLELAGRKLPRHFTIRMDEPPELLGADTGPSPQEMLMAAFSASLLAGYVAACALEGIVLESLSIDSEGEIDLRGSLGLDASVRPGYEEIRYTVRIRGNGSPEQFQRIHELVLATSPNRWSVANAVDLKAEILVEPSALLHK
jgi:uncharacterized OsmC-like protein